MTHWEAFITIIVIALATLATRALPFVLFPPGRRVPGYLAYLGRVLPAASIGMLVVYCVRHTELSAWPHGLPELAGIALTALLQYKTKNALLSIIGGTALYMLLVQQVFV